MPQAEYEEQSTISVKGDVARTSASWVSWIGLCAASFFLAEIGGVTMPFVNTYLVECGWGYDTIGAAAALAGLVSFLTHSPAGFIIDFTRRHRLLLAGSSMLVGACFGVLPFVCESRIGVFILLAIAGFGKPFFGPITNALTLEMAGHAGLNRSLGFKEGWNHAGNIVAALSAMVLVSYFPVTAVFIAVTVVSVLAAASGFLIRPGELHHDLAASSRFARPFTPFLELIRARRVATLLASAVLFHLANAPVMPLVAQKIRHVGGSNSQVAGVVLIAQAVMIPVALLAGFLGERWGRKPVLAIGFAVLPVRIFLYAFTEDPSELVSLQALDGIGAGVFGVTAVAVCGDLTRGRGHFNGLAGVLATAVGTGGVVGPLVSGLIVQHLGFSAAFFTFSGIATAAAVLLIGWMPETRGIRA
jgi:MFS family permease